ncbi:MAG TPA: SRPBCC domain-containing protein [Vitreimonas sp.]|uniref:SRPBCC family protein n=1 Tax=Vitreimonas sp. TaxID=3069702 RepID=UPI002D28B3EF|nr:SRPBCC domain-containing protein [Vitreimonas sp.]HYD88403.1 SRPBCC domain-containing protein [Vitreimonas sp.]
MRLLRSLLVLAACVFAAPAFAQSAVVDCSRAETSGERTLCHEVVVPASAAELWPLWTTSAGVGTWLAPVAAVEARPGGVLETSYDPDGRIGDPANIRNRIVAVAPERLLVIQVAHAPPNFPHAAEVARLATLIEFEPVGEGATRVRVSMLGYREGEAYEALYHHFAWGNAWTLNKLVERVTSGPIDWRAEANAASR